MDSPCPSLRRRGPARLGWSSASACPRHSTVVRTSFPQPSLGWRFQPVLPEQLTGAYNKTHATRRTQTVPTTRVFPTISVLGSIFVTKHTASSPSRISRTCSPSLSGSSTLGLATCSSLASRSTLYRIASPLSAVHLCVASQPRRLAVDPDLVSQHLG